MALTPTTQKELGFKAPEFDLLDVVTGNNQTFSQLKGTHGTVVMFICNHCPFVVHVREGLVKLAQDYLTQGIGFIAISSNDVENYPADSPELMKEMAMEFNFPFPYFYDETQDVARAYDAACTPDFSIFDADDKCVYRGQLDDSRPGNEVPVTGESIREVCDLLLHRQPIPKDNQRPSVGCNIKWK